MGREEKVFSARGGELKKDREGLDWFRHFGSFFLSVGGKGEEPGERGGEGCKGAARIFVFCEGG